MIGKEVKDSPTQHYVREAGRDVVYVVDLNPERLSTNFEDWIQKDLLKLSPWEIEKIQIKDYSAELQPVMTEQGLAIQVAWDPRSEMIVGYDDKAGKWTPMSLKKFDKSKGDYAEIKLAVDEELNAKKLDELKTSLDDLKIVDVVKKPAGLSADLKAGGDFLEQCRCAAGPALAQASRPSRLATAAKGRTSYRMRAKCSSRSIDGVEYVLRFGDLRMATAGDSKSKPSAKDATADKTKAKSNDKNVQRYMFAMARFDENAVKKPELAELPALPEGVDEKAVVADEGSEATKTRRRRTMRRSRMKQVGYSTEDAKCRRKAAEDKDAEKAKEENRATKSQKKSRRSLPSGSESRPRTSTRLDDYQQKLDKGRQTVKDLNLRFGDWYFVVSNDVFKKIRLASDDVIKKKDEGRAGRATGRRVRRGPAGRQIDPRFAEHSWRGRLDRRLEFFSAGPSAEPVDCLPDGRSASQASARSVTFPGSR